MAREQYLAEFPDAKKVHKYVNNTEFDICELITRFVGNNKHFLLIEEVEGSGVDEIFNILEKFDGHIIVPGV
jgi:hypothetical protein